MYPADSVGSITPSSKTSRPLGLVSAPAAPSISSGGQYKSSTPRAVPQATQGPIQRSGTPSAPAKKPAPKKAAPKPKIPGINKYLAGDTTYNDQTSQLRAQLEKFKTDNASQQSMVGQDFQTALQKMMSQRDSDLGNIQNDFAARGLLNSGLYTDAVGKYNTDYESQKGDLQTGEQRSLSQLLADLSNYQTENSSGMTAAQQDAIRRRAQQYGITA